MSNFTATVTAEGFVTVQNEGFAKNISLGDYLTLLRSIADEQEEDNEVGSPIRYPSSIHSSSKTSTGYIVNLYYPEREAVLEHSCGGNYEVYMPNVMICIELREVNGRPGEFSLGNIYWLATDKEPNELPTTWPRGGNSSDHIWTLPLPNVWSDSRMCTGGNRLPSVIYYDWTMLDMLYNDVLLGSPFNNDLSVSGLRSDSSNGSTWLGVIEQWYKREDTTKFPYEKLVNY